MIKTYIDGVLQESGGTVTSVNNITPTAGNVALTQDNIGDGTTYKQYSQAEKTKLSNITGTNTGDETTLSILNKIGDGSKISSTYLPSYVDDVLEFANVASFPATGETGKIYIALDVNLTYRWGGSGYVEISPSIALGETSSTAYRGDRGASAYAHSILTSGTNPHNTTFANIASKPTTIAGYGITDGVTLVGSETLTNKTLTAPVLNTEITGTGITITGEANKLFKFSAIANTILHFLRIRKSSTTALSVQDDSSVDVLNVDSTNKIVTSYNQKITGLAGTGNRMVAVDSSGNLSATGVNFESLIQQPYNYTAIHGINYINSGTGGQNITMPPAVIGTYVEFINKTLGVNAFLAMTGANKIYDIAGNDVTSTYTSIFALSNIKRIRFIGTRQIDRGGAILNSGAVDWVVVEKELNLAGAGTRMVVADASGNLSASVQLQQSVSNGSANNTAWVNIGNVVPTLGFTYMIGYYNIASPTLKGTAMFQSDGTTLTQISKVDNTTIGVSFRINAGLLQVITSTGGSSIGFSGNIIGV